MLMKSGVDVNVVREVYICKLKLQIMWYIKGYCFF